MWWDGGARADDPRRRGAGQKMVLPLHGDVGENESQRQGVVPSEWRASQGRGVAGRHCCFIAVHFATRYQELLSLDKNRAMSLQPDGKTKASRSSSAPSGSSSTNKIKDKCVTMWGPAAASQRQRTQRKREDLGRKDCIPLPQLCSSTPIESVGRIWCDGETQLLGFLTRSVGLVHPGIGCGMPNGSALLLVSRDWGPHFITFLSLLSLYLYINAYNICIIDFHGYILVAFPLSTFAFFSYADVPSCSNGSFQVWFPRLLIRFEDSTFACRCIRSFFRFPPSPPPSASLFTMWLFTTNKNCPMSPTFFLRTNTTTFVSPAINEQQTN